MPGVGKRHYKGQEETFRVVAVFMILTMVMNLQVYTYMSKSIQFHALNICCLLYANYISIVVNLAFKNAIAF